MMNNLRQESWYVGNLAGVPMFVHWSVIVLVLLVSTTGGGVEQIILVLIALVVGIVLHELGHGLMAKALGAHGITITLWAFGGLCSSRRDPARLGREIAIVAAGPAVSLALWLGSDLTFDLLTKHAPATLFDGRGLSLLGLGLKISASVNMTLFLFNMMPIYPMDGGQLVYNTALATTRNQLLARQISLFLAVVGTIAFFAWRTDLIRILYEGGNVGAWAGQLGMSDLFLAIVLAWILRSAFAILY